jgi:hypothetical protein
MVSPPMKQLTADEPGVHLTLTDKLCKQACQAE